MISHESPVIKICGLRDHTSATAATSAEATALGFVFAESQRQVTPETVAEVLRELTPKRPPAIGVFVNETPNRIMQIVSSSGIDVVQLSGDEATEVLEGIDVPVWKAVRFPIGTSIENACLAIEPWLTHPRRVEAILVDAAVTGSYGGSGHRADWALAAELARRYPIILAGGLNPGNVGEAIATVGPIGVDVSSGVETDGTKDPVKILAFVDASARVLRSP